MRLRGPVAAAVAGLLAFAASSGAGAAPPPGNVFYSGAYGDSIGRAQTDGASPNPRFVTEPTGIVSNALAASGGYLFWLENTDALLIGRSRLDGSDIRRALIYAPGQGNSESLAASATHIYWSDGTTISRATLDGTTIERAFLRPRGVSPDALAANGTHLFWIDQERGRIGRATLDGRLARRLPVSRLQTNNPTALAADASHLYWNADSSIGRMRTNGTARRRLIAADDPYGLAVGGGYLYWGGYHSDHLRERGPIGRVRTDGRDRRPNFIATTNSQQGVAGVAVAPR